MTISRRQLRAFIATAAVILMLAGCMTPEAIDYHRRHPEYRLFWYQGRLTYPIMLDPYAVPHEIVKQMTEREYRVWMYTLKNIGTNSERLER